MTRRSARTSETGTTASASAAQVEQMVADPEGYFARARQEARAEARRYVASHERRLRTA